MEKLKNLKSALGLFILFFLMVSIPLSLSLIKSRQEIRKEAAGAGFSLTLISSGSTYYYLPSPNQPVFDVQIQLATGANNVRGGDISLKFDPAYLEVVDAYTDTNNPGIQVTPGTLFPNQMSVINQADNTTGIIKLSLGSSGLDIFYNGTGIFGTIKFKAKQSVSSTQISFDPPPTTMVVTLTYENLVTSTPTGLTLSIPLDTIAPTAPVPSSPANNWVTNQNPLTPTFTWSAAVDNETGIANYGIQVDNENTFANPITYQSNALTGTSVTMPSSLSTNGAYYWRIKAIDKAGNGSAWSPIQTFTIDSLAPAAITTLSVLAGTPATSAVNLSWTAPNANPGTATSYEIRYLTSNITEANWASATLATNPPAPLAAGTAQTLTISSLNPGTTYYFAIKSKDSANNTSALSNVPNLATTQLPITLSFTLKIQGLTTPDATAKPDVHASLLIRTTGGATVYQNNDVTLKNNKTTGTYGIESLDLGTTIVPGSYQVFIKGTSHLRKNMTITPTYPLLALIRGNNTVDWINQTLLAGDIDPNRDDTINMMDFNRLANDYIPNTPANSPADFNLDGSVNMSDFNIFASNYLQSGNPL